jgi:hypothetical protein
VATHDLSCVEAVVGGMDLEPVVCPRPACAVEQTPVGLTLRDRRKPLIPAKCGPTAARRA